MKYLCTTVLLCIYVCNYAQELSSDASTTLLLHFNNTVKGVNNEVPVDSANIQYEAGKWGQALRCSIGTVLQFDTTQNIITDSGTIEFWMKPEYSPGNYIFDMQAANGLYIQSGSSTYMYLNAMPTNGHPQVSVYYNQFLSLGNWHHLAFTWGSGALKMYINGALNQTSNYNFPFSPVPLTRFAIGAALQKYSYYNGLLDELRISNRPRTATEICSDYMTGLGTPTSLVSDPPDVFFRKGWNVYLDKPNTYQHPTIKAVYGTDTVPVNTACISWTVSDTSLLNINAAQTIVHAVGAGNPQLIAHVGSLSLPIQATVFENYFPEEHVTVIDSFLATPVPCYIRLIPTVAYIYLPTQDGVNIDTYEVPNVPQSIATVKQRVLECSRFTKFSLEEGSKYRGYQNPAAQPYVGYQIVEYVFVYEPLPRGIKNFDGRWFPDFNQIMNRFNGRKLVDTLGVKEVWVYGYDIGEIVASESNMSSSVTGDISNSYRFEDDLPIYNNSYIVYNYNIQRGGNEAVHNHGHQFESIIDYVAQRQDGNTNLFTQKFRGYGSNGTPPIGRAGDTHHPPNTTVDYDYCNSTLVASDIFDWKPNGGATTMVNCNSWSSIPYPWPAGVSHDANSNWFILWMQSFPGNGNEIPYNNKWMTNWWRFLSNWNAQTINIGLYDSSKAIKTSLCTTYETAASGNWNNPATWVGNVVPPNGQKVVVKHILTTNVPATVSSITIAPGCHIIIPPSILFEVTKEK